MKPLYYIIIGITIAGFLLYLFRDKLKGDKGDPGTKGATGATGAAGAAGTSNSSQAPVSSSTNNEPITAFQGGIFGFK